MTVKELREALKGVPGNTPVAMVDEMSVVFAEMVDGVFVVSDMGPDCEEPIEYWREEEADECRKNRREPDRSNADLSGMDKSRQSRRSRVR